MAASALRAHKGSLARVLDRESSQDVVRCSGIRAIPTGDSQEKGALDKRYAEMCGPVDTKPLVEWWPGGKAQRPAEPVVVIHVRGISLNAEAIRRLTCESLAIGIDYAGRLIIAPASSVKDAPAVYRRPKNYNNYLGGASLVAWLTAQGFAAGTYRTTVTDQGWLVADKNGLTKTRTRNSVG